MVLLGGCTDPQGLFKPPGAALPQARVSVHDLALRLGLEVESADAVSATLCGPGNSVVVYADPGGEVYVNGVSVTRGGIAAVGGVLYVPADAEAKVQEALRAAAPRLRPPVRTARRPQRPKPQDLGRIVIDPGHGGHDPGAIAITGHREKDLVLDVSRRLADMLRADGATIHMTRSSDTFVDLYERAAIANRFGADLFVSLHADSATRRGACGYTVYVSRSASAKSLAAAGRMAQNMGGTGLASRGIRRADYKVLVHTRCPAMLVELGYLSNPFDAAKLADPAFRAKLAEAVADGIRDTMAGK